MIRCNRVVMHGEAQLAPHGADAPPPPTLSHLCLNWLDLD
jgi:hypothetical protein